MSLDSDPSFWKWLTGSIATGSAGLFGYHKFLIGKIDKKADAEDVKKNNEHIVKLYENAERDRQTLHECIDRISTQIHMNHVEVIRELGRKVDR